MKRVAHIASALFLFASPWVLCWTLSQHRVAVAAAALVAWVVIRTLPLLLTAGRQQRTAALQLPVIALVFAILGWVFHEGRWLMVLPSAAQAMFGAAFLRSLWRTPLVENFARMVKPELSVPERAHCRSWTAIWGMYLLMLAAVGLGLAKWASLSVWTIYVGVANYGLLGMLFAVEYVVRKVRFRDYGRNPLDWILSKLFPTAPSV